ncbi:MAG: hypothetical protein ABIW79_03440 [Gemmatimonas sp.]
MSAGLALVLLVIGTYLAAHVAFDWLGRRLHIVSGAEYVLLGILLGPQVGGVLSTDLLESFAPVTALALGWMGAIIGSRFMLSEMIKVPGVTWRIAFAESMLTLVIVAGLELLLIRWLFGLSTDRALGPAIALGAFASATAVSGIQFAVRRFGGRGPIAAQLKTTSGTNLFVAVTTFGILLASSHPSDFATTRPLTPTEWTVVTIAIGIVGGALFHLLMGREEHVDRLFIALAGMLVLISGAATYLRLSPVMASMFFGAMLANTSAQRSEIRSTLQRIDRPLYFALLIFAGATWRPSAQTAWLLPVLLFLVARAVAKVGGARLMSRINDMLPILGPHWGRALLGQGGIVMALAVNYLYQDTLALPNVVFTAAVVSVVLTDVFSSRLAASVMVPAASPAKR